MVTALRDWGVWGNSSGKFWQINPSDVPTQHTPFLIPFFLSLNGNIRFHNGLRRPNPHDCGAEGGYVLFSAGSFGGIESANCFFDMQAQMLLRERARSSPTSMLVSPCRQQSRALSVLTVVISCLSMPMADRPLRTMELQL